MGVRIMSQGCKNSTCRWQKKSQEDSKERSVTERNQQRKLHMGKAAVVQGSDWPISTGFVH